ncbi:MAG: CsbD family protein [Bdellovibrionota bacterium]
MINNNISGGNWKELKGRIRSAWGKLTDDELETAKGDVTAIAGLIQKKYGTAQEETRKKLNDWFAGKSSTGQDKADRRPA